MFELGALELLLIVLAAVLLFGPAVVVTWLVLTFARGSERPGTPGGIDERTDPAMVVARERFAAGEITAEEFESIKRTLGY